MATDILESAQKAINDAAETIDRTPGLLPDEPPPLTPDPGQPAPDVPVAEPLQQASVQQTDTAVAPEQPIMTPEPLVRAAPPPPIRPAGNRPKSALLFVFMTLLLALPVGVFYISKQNESLTDTRSRANPPPGPYTIPITSENHCRQLGGEPVSEPGGECGEGGYRRECIINGQHYKYGCGNTGGDDNGDDDNAPTATPTTGVTPVCQNIKIYKGGQQVTPSGLKPGDDVVLAVKGNLSPTKAHFRVNGGNWTETATHNAANEWTLDYKIPTGVTQFVIEGEVFTNGAWR